MNYFSYNIGLYRNVTCYRMLRGVNESVTYELQEMNFREFRGTVEKIGKSVQQDINTTARGWAVKQEVKGGCVR